MNLLKKEDLQLLRGLGPAHEKGMDLWNVHSGIENFEKINTLIEYLLKHKKVQDRNCYINAGYSFEEIFYLNMYIQF